MGRIYKIKTFIFLCAMLVALSVANAQSLRSINSKNAVQVTFKNNTPSSLDVYWLDYSGGEKKYAVLAPGKLVTFPTFETHPWRFKTGDRVVDTYVTGNAKVQEHFVALFKSLQSQTPVAITFQYLGTGDLNVYWVDYQGNEKDYGTLAAGSQMTVGTFATHPWLFRQSGAVRVLYTANTSPCQYVGIGTPQEVGFSMLRQLQSVDTPPTSEGIKQVNLMVFAQGYPFATDIGQTPYVKFTISAKIASNGRQKFVHLDTKGSAVSADKDGKLKYDSSEKRGYYLEQAKVSIRPKNNRFKKIVDAPETTPSTGSVTSTSGVDLSTGGSISADPSANFGVGVSFGNSYSENLTDFIVENSIGDKDAIHLYKLASTTAVETTWTTAGGSVNYQKWQDLVRKDAAGQFSGTPLNNIPRLARTSMPLASQGIWMVPADFSMPVVFEIEVQLTLRFVEKTNEVVKWSGKTNIKTYTITQPVEIDMGIIK